MEIRTLALAEYMRSTKLSPSQVKQLAALLYKGFHASKPNPRMQLGVTGSVELAEKLAAFLLSH